MESGAGILGYARGCPTLRARTIRRGESSRAFPDLLVNSTTLVNMGSAPFGSGQFTFDRRKERFDVSSAERRGQRHRSPIRYRFQAS